MTCVTHLYISQGSESNSAKLRAFNSNTTAATKWTTRTEPPQTLCS